MAKLTRREFLRGAAVSAAGVAAFGLMTSVGAQETENTKPQVPSYSVDETIDADIVVVGAGAAGLSASIQAAQLGAKVVLIEKKAYLGGNATGTEGIFAVGSPLQKEAGIADVPLYALIEEEMVYCNFRSSAELWSKYIRTSADNIQWLLDQGVVFQEVSTYRNVSSFECFHWWQDGKGSTMLATLGERVVAAQNVEIHLDTAAQDLVFADGKVSGVYAYDEELGKQYQFNAKAVVLAAGGFASNFEFVEMMTTLDTTYAYTSNSNDGAGLRMALSVGAGKAATCILPKTCVGGYTVRDPISVGACFQPILMVNENGARFVREDVNITSYSALYFNAVTSQKAAFTVFDKTILDYLGDVSVINPFSSFTVGTPITGLKEQLEEALAAGNENVYKADTLEDLAAAMGVNKDNFLATVERYNELCSLGSDEDLGKISDYLYAVGEGPYYACKQAPAITTTIGGIDVDLDNAVVDEAGLPIPGLYSAGVDCCKLYKETYNYQLSGGMVGYCIYSGRIAAQNAVETYC